MSRSKAKNLTLDRESAQIETEEQAELVAAQMALRGNAVQIDGALMKLRGQLMRPNALLKTNEIKKALEEINGLSRTGLDQLKKLSA